MPDVRGLERGQDLVLGHRCPVPAAVAAGALTNDSRGDGLVGQQLVGVDPDRVRLALLSDQVTDPGCPAGVGDHGGDQRASYARPNTT